MARRGDRRSNKKGLHGKIFENSIITSKDKE